MAEWTEWKNTGKDSNIVFAFSKGCPYFWGDAFTAVHTNGNQNNILTLTSKVSGSYKMKLYLKTSSANSMAYTVKIRDEVVLTADWLNIPYESTLEFDLSVGDTIVFSPVSRDINMYGIVISEV